MTFRQSLLGMLIAAATLTPVSAIPLTVSSIRTYTYLGPTVEAHVRVAPLLNDCTTVVQGTWTDPAGGTVTRMEIASGTRHRAEFPIYSTLVGDFVFNVDDIMCGETNTYAGDDSVSVAISGSSFGSPAIVDVTWDKPSGSINVSVTTNNRGKVSFTTPKDFSGVCTLGVDDVTASRLTYDDPDTVSNSITSELHYFR